MAEFDKLRAARELLEGLTSVQNSLRRQERAAEERMSNAETELNEIRKLVGYLRIQTDDARWRIEQLEAEAKAPT